MTATRLLDPFVSPGVLAWSQDGRPSVEGTLAFFDVSGFTRLSERLARLGKLGAETITEIVDGIYEGLIGAAFAHDGDVVQFSGDALLIVFGGADHAPRAARAARDMQDFLARSGRVETPSGAIRLRMSAGMHSGRFHIALLGTHQIVPLLFGPDTSRTLECEKAAAAGQVLTTPETARLLPASWTGAAGAMRRLRLAAVDDERIPTLRPSLDPRLVTRFVPVPLRGPLADHTLSGEHRPLTLAFAMARDHDAVIERAGVDGLRAALVAVGNALDDACARWDLLWIGADALVDACDFFFVAGAPTLREGDEERMLRAACELRALDLPLRLAVGINRGRVFAGPVGHPERRTYGVTGDATNLAARVMAHAHPGQVLVTDAVLAPVRSPTRTDPIAPFAAKGKRLPVQAHSLQAVLDRGPEPGDRLPLVGRDRELATALAALDAARGGRGGALDISGGPGLGKSRLVEEIVLRAEPTAVIRTNASPYATATAYATARPVVRAALGIPVDADPDRAAIALRARVESTAPALVEWLPLLATAAGTTAAPTPATERIPPQLLADRLTQAVVELLRATLTEPTLLVVEDLHWADPASRTLFDAVAAAASTQPWLLCTTRRPDVAPLVDATTVALEPLDRAASAQLLAAASGVTGITDLDASALADRAAGNPLFLRELAGAPTDTAGLPESVEQLLGARIDTLTPADRSLLRDAAVVGPVVDLTLLAAVRDTPDDPADDAWARLTDYVERTEPGVVRFQHDLVRTTAYEGLSYRRRRFLHGAIGDALAASAAAADTPEAGIATLCSLHFHAANRRAECWAWSVRAARAADVQAAPAEAFTLLGRALDAAKALPDIAPATIGALAEDRADLATRLGRGSDTHALLRLSRRVRPDDTTAIVRCLRKHGDACEKEGRYPQALRWYARAQRAATDATGTAAELPALRRETRQARLSYAGVLYFEGRLREAIAIGEGVLVEAEADRDAAAVAQAGMQIEHAAAELSPPEVRGMTERSEQIFRELGDDVSLGNLLLNAGIIAYRASEWSEADRRYRAAAAVYERVFDQVGMGLADNNLGELLADQGRDADARPRLERALRLFRASRYEMGIALSAVQLARLELRSGHVETAAHLLDDAEARFRGMGATAYLLDARVRQAERHLAIGDPATAATIAAAVDASLRKEGAGAALPAIVTRVRAEAAAGLDDAAFARALATDALDHARHEQSAYEEVRALDVLARLDWREGRTTGSWASERDRLMTRLAIVGLPAVSWDPDPGS